MGRGTNLDTCADTQHGFGGQFTCLSETLGDAPIQDTSELSAHCWRDHLEKASAITIAPMVEQHRHRVNDLDLPSDRDGLIQSASRGQPGRPRWLPLIDDQVVVAPQGKLCAVVQVYLLQS